MPLENHIALNVGEQDSSKNGNCNDQGKGSCGRSQSKNFSGGRGRGDCHKRNNNNHSNRKNDANGNDNNDDNGNNTSQSKIKHSSEDFKCGTKELKNHHHDAAVSNQADICMTTAEAVIDHCVNQVRWDNF